MLLFNSLHVKMESIEGNGVGLEMFRKTQVSWSTRDGDRPGTRVWMQTPPACGALLGKKVSTESLACHFFFFRKRNCRWRFMFGCTWDAPLSHPPCSCHSPAPSPALAGTLLKEFQLPALGYQERPRTWASWPPSLARDRRPQRMGKIWRDCIQILRQITGPL